MKIGLLKIDIFIPHSNSLKEKRRVTSSLKNRIRNKFNVSIAEYPDDTWQRACFYIVCVNSSLSLVENVFMSIRKDVEYGRDYQLLDFNHTLL